LSIYLLTHSRELGRKTNTGGLVKQVLGKQCSIFEWQRKQPNTELLQHIQEESIALLSHADNQVLGTQSNPFDSYILIDATWQEAQKMYNHSPYLHGLPKVSLKPDTPSIYNLRRNQKEAGLCTAECASILLNLSGHTKQANILDEKLISHIKSLR